MSNTTGKVSSRFNPAYDLGISVYKAKGHDISYGLSAHGYNPMLSVGNKVFILQWSSIIALADKAGLFDGLEEVDHDMY